MSKYLDSNGVLYLWSKIKAKFVAKENGKGLSTNDYTTAEKEKLAGVASGANNYSLPTASADTLGGVKIGENLTIDGTGTLSAIQGSYELPTASTTTKGGIKIGANLTMNGEVLNATDTTYNEATTAAAGLMSADDKTKLSGIESGANKTTVDSALNANSTNPVQNKVINSALGNKVDKVSGKELSTNDYTTAEKNKLAGIATGANNYSLPTASASVLGGVMVGTNLSIDANGVLSATDTTYSDATTSTAGLMSTSDKSKLDAFGAASTYALKSDITTMYKYKGSVATYANLPSTGQTVGDVYNVEASGMNYAWDGTTWDALGEIFQIDAITNAEIDTIVAS